MNWKDYEKEVHGYFSKKYPNSTITYDAKITGRYSKVERQIDILIEDDVAGFPIKVIVDAKYFSKTIDVKCVESFIAMLNDVDANQGLLVTRKGYSKAAINRAYYGPEELELDVLNFDELLEHQGLGAIPYAGKNALVLSSPFGWVIDNKKYQDFHACLYQRGLDLPKAQKKNEWIYFNFLEKNKHTSSIKELVAKQNARMEELYTNICLTDYRSPKRKDLFETHIRIAQFDELSGKEITGYIDCSEFIAFFVLFTPEEVQSRNLRKLAHLLQYAIPIKVKFNNIEAIEQLDVKLTEIAESAERAPVFYQLADLHLQMDKKDDAMRYRRLCWDSDPTYYKNITPLIIGELSSNNPEEAMNYSAKFFALYPENPRVMQDLLSIYEDEKFWILFEKLTNRLKLEYSEENEALGNIYIHCAIHLNNSNQKDKSIEHFKIARSLFTKVDKYHSALQQIDHALNG
jgi:hypothetical protein